MTLTQTTLTRTTLTPTPLPVRRERGFWSGGRGAGVVRVLPGAGARRMGWERWLAVSGGADGGEDCREVGVDGVIGEAQDAVPGGAQERFPLGIVFALCGVNLAVELDDEATIGAAEIDDERPDGVLAAELQTVEAAIAEGVPEDFFGEGLPSSQVTSRWHVVATQRVVVGHGESLADSRTTLTPTPLPMRRERGFWLGGQEEGLWAKAQGEWHCGSRAAVRGQHFPLSSNMQMPSTGRPDSRHAFPPRPAHRERGQGVRV